MRTAGSLLLLSPLVLVVFCLSLRASTSTVVFVTLAKLSDLAAVDLYFSSHEFFSLPTFESDSNIPVSSMLLVDSLAL